jgi:hypothetical protein
MDHLLARIRYHDPALDIVESQTHPAECQTFQVMRRTKEALCRFVDYVGTDYRIVVVAGGDDRMLVWQTDDPRQPTTREQQWQFKHEAMADMMQVDQVGEDA